MTHEDGSMQYQFVVLKKTKSKVRLIEKSTGPLPFDELKTRLVLAHPVVIVLSGKGIILKEIGADITEENIITKALPGADARDLSATYYSNSGQSWVSIVKRSVIEKAAESFAKSGFRIISVYPGFAGLIGIMKTILPDEKPIISGSYRLDFPENSITISRTDSSVMYSIDQQEIPSQLLPAFATALCQWLSPPHITWIPDRVRQVSKEEIYCNQFNWLTTRVPFIFLGVLVINFFIFSSLNRKEKFLTSELSVYQADIDEASNLEQKIIDRKKLSEDLGVERKEFISSIADRVGESVPGEITLTKMSFNPLKSKMKEDQPLEFENGVLNIVGQTNQGSIMNQWMKKLSDEDWTGDVELLRFDTEKGMGTFEILIHI